jgi:hypothetical protein
MNLSEAIEELNEGSLASTKRLLSSDVSSIQQMIKRLPKQANTLRGANKEEAAGELDLAKDALEIAHKRIIAALKSSNIIRMKRNN